MAAISAVSHGSAFEIRASPVQGQGNESNPTIFRYPLTCSPHFCYLDPGPCPDIETMHMTTRTLVLLILIGSGGYPDAIPPARSQSPALAGRLDDFEECTIGVASSRATQDGRPMIWKSRDTEGHDNAVYFNTSRQYRFLSIVDAGERNEAWMALNERGFAILNSALYDLAPGDAGMSNGVFMSYAVGTCASMGDFVQLLDSTNTGGRRTAANFAVMDSTGAAAIFETGGHSYWKYDATDATNCPKGYLVRTNFSFAGGGTEGNTRFLRSSVLVDAFYEGDSLLPKTILRYQMRDLADPGGDPYPIPYCGSINNAPYGFIPATTTICRTITASAAVIQGVRRGEPSRTSTMWTILGRPISGIAVPYWPLCEPPALSADRPTALLNNVANEIFLKISGEPAWPSYINTLPLRDNNGEGVLKDIFKNEDVIFAAADTILRRWREGGSPTSEAVRAESTYAEFAFDALTAISRTITGTEPASAVTATEGYSLAANYPNPFNPKTVIRFQTPLASFVRLVVYDLLGREVAVLMEGSKEPGTYAVEFDGSMLSSGTYFYRIIAGDFAATRKMLLVN
jgi:hypothetical protein